MDYAPACFPQMKSRLYTLFWPNCLNLKDTMAHYRIRAERQETTLGFKLHVLAARVQFVTTRRKDTTEQVMVNFLRTRNDS
jgi:hypothetical protein